MQLKKDNAGATAIEYGLIAALIAVVIIVALQFTGTNLSKSYSKIASSMSAANL